MPLVEVNVLPLVGLEIPGLAAGVEPEAALVHDLAADSATLEMRVNREGTEMGVRLIGVALAPGGEPIADPAAALGPIAIRFGRDLSRWVWIAVGWQVPGGAHPATATSVPPSRAQIGC